MADQFFVAVGRPPSEKPAAANRRANRAALRAMREGRTVAFKATVRPSIIKTGLSWREQRILRRQTDRMFLEGKIDLRYMGIYYLELQHLCWTPPFLANDPICLELPVEKREAWVDAEFTTVFNWWSTRLTSERLDVISQSRFTKGA